VDAIRSKHSEMTKTAMAELPDSDYAYVWIGDDNQKTRQLPLKTAAQVKAAADWLIEYRDRLPFNDRHVIATRILEKAASYGADLGDQLQVLEQQAGRGACDFKEVTAMIHRRALLADNPIVRDRLEKLAESVGKANELHMGSDHLVKLAGVIDNFDRNHHLVGQYGSVLERPEAVLFRHPFSKVADELQRVCATQSGKVWDKSAFARLNVSELRDLLGQEFTSRVSNGIVIDVEKMATEVAALPRGDVELVESMLADRGVAPAMSKAASVKLGLPKELLAAFAQEYQPAG
jgi:hypothetical protein